jgi:hypothetical protein
MTAVSTASPENTQALRFFLRNDWLTSPYFTDEQKTETRFVDTLHSTLIDLLVRQVGNCNALRRQGAAEYICKGTCPEPCIKFTSPDVSIPLVVTEVKGFEASNQRCFPQAFIAASNLCLELFNDSKLHVDDCVVPIITLAGDGYRFGAVYLTEVAWPVMVSLTEAMNPLDGNETVNNLTKWFFRVMDFGKQTVALCGKQKLHQKNLERRRQPQPKLGNVFLKPIREDSFNRKCELFLLFVFNHSNSE